MKKAGKKDYKLSYESDGVMGKERKQKQDKKDHSKDDKMFFNITEGSE
ncbi:hypothetical protein [Sediminibacillus massiliensis]|nr:hypothetical protein [Sediminibacillus massiliensis]